MIFNGVNYVNPKFQSDSVMMLLVQSEFEYPGIKRNELEGGGVHLTQYHIKKIQFHVWGCDRYLRVVMILFSVFYKLFYKFFENFSLISLKKIHGTNKSSPKMVLGQMYLPLLISLFPPGTLTQTLR